MKIEPKYQGIMAPLNRTDYDKLNKSIKENGLWHPIVTCNGEILDGHRRYKICQKLGITPRTIEMKFSSEEKKILYIIGANDDRRQLTPGQRVWLQLLKKPFLVKRAKANQRLSKGKYMESQGLAKLPNLNIRNHLAKAAGVSPRTFGSAEMILKNGTEKEKADLMTGRRKINSIANDIVRRKHVDEILKTQTIQSGKRADYVIYNQNNDTICTKVDMIYTDPPYASSGEDMVDLSAMSRMISSSLKDDGCALVYWGGTRLPELLNAFAKSGLQYTWTFTIRMHGHQLVYKYRIFSTYRQILFFTKPGYTPIFPVSDSVSVEGEKWESKKYHPWGQSEKPALYYINFLTRNDDIIYDPYVGSGTFGIASCKLGRKFIGCDINKEYCDIAEKRLATVRVGRGIDEKWYKEAIPQ